MVSVQVAAGWVLRRFVKRGRHVLKHLRIWGGRIGTQARRWRHAGKRTVLPTVNRLRRLCRLPRRKPSQRKPGLHRAGPCNCQVCRGELTP